MQVLASEPAKIAQTVDGTSITIDYYRPLARGRELFGRLVPWEAIWTPGANWATTLEAGKDIRLNNHPLPKGRYSIWIHTRKDADWTVILSRMARVYHLWPPPKEDEELRFDVRPEQGPHVEVLTWSFPAVMRDGAALWLQWGSTIVPLHVAVVPTRVATLTQRERAGYVGVWRLEINNTETRVHSALEIEIVEAKGGLRMKGNALQPQWDSEIDLIPIGGNQFHPLYNNNGKPLGVEPGETFVFIVDDGRAVSFELRGPDNRLVARGTRAN